MRTLPLCWLHAQIKSVGCLMRALAFSKDLAAWVPASWRCLDRILICNENHSKSVALWSTWSLSVCCADAMSFPAIENLSIDWSCESLNLESPSMTRLSLNCTPRQRTWWEQDGSLPNSGDCQLSLGSLPTLAELQLLYTFAHRKVTCSWLTNVLYANSMIYDLVFCEWCVACV